MQTERRTDKQTYLSGDRSPQVPIDDLHTYIKKDINAHRHTHKQTHRQIDGQMDRQADRQTNGQTDKHTVVTEAFMYSPMTDRPTFRQTDKQSLVASEALKSPPMTDSHT